MLVAGAHTRDVAPVGEDHEELDGRRKAQQSRVARLQEIHENDQRGSREHARETDIAGEHEHGEPAAEDRQEQPRIERPDDADHGRSALAAAKAEPDRIHVPDDHGEAVGEREPGARDLRVERDTRQRSLRQIEHRQHPFADVYGEDRQSEQLPLGAQRVRGAGIAAAGKADVDTAQLPEHETAEQCTEEIGEERLYREFQHAAIMTSARTARGLAARRQMHLGEHAAHAAAAEMLDDGNLGRQHIAVLFEAAPLVRIETCPSRGRESDQLRAGRRELEHVARESLHLCEGNLDDFPVRAESLTHRVAGAFLGDRFGAYHGEAGTEGQHHVGVIHGPARGVDGLERHQVVVEQLRELAQRIEIGARRNIRVGHVPRTIEHEAAGALEVLTELLAVAQVDRARDAKPDGRDFGEHLVAALQTPVGRHHRIEHHGAVMMKAHPVVRENRIRLHGAQSILDQDDLHTRPRELLGQCVELAQRRLVHALLLGVRARPGCARFARVLLEHVARSRLRIESEPGRPHHQHSRCALRFLMGRGFEHRARLYPTRASATKNTRDLNLPVDIQKLVLATLLTAASSLPAQGANARPEEPSTQKAAGGYPFSFDTLLEQAKRLAAKPYAPQRSTLPAGLDKLSPEQYRSIHFNRDAAIWRNENLPFRVELLRTTFNQQAPPVTVSTVEGDTAHDLVATPAMFEMAPSLPQLGKVSLPLSGFRLVTQINSKKIWDEFLVFQGASYFRGVAKGLLYGLSARGLAINTAEPVGEEFPAFTHFWIERPAPHATAIVIDALLESESITGAYRFTVQPGAETVMDVTCTLFPRTDLRVAGIAPLTSMFLFDETNRGRLDDYRPEVHDSDGLQITSSTGEHIFRQLANPTKLQVSTFTTRPPQGFGLVQRSRDSSDFEDFEDAYERRPSAWIEPKGDWGPGAVELVEIPSGRESNDNIVAFWRPSQGLAAGRPAEFAYRLSWLAKPAMQKGLGEVVATRSGASLDGKRRVFVLDIVGAGDKTNGLTVDLSASAGKISNAALTSNTALRGLRASFEIDPNDADLIEMRLRITRGDHPVSETWLYRWTPP